MIDCIDTKPTSRAVQSVSIVYCMVKMNRPAQLLLSAFVISAIPPSTSIGINYCTRLDETGKGTTTVCSNEEERSFVTCKVDRSSNTCDYVAIKNDKFDAVLNNFIDFDDVDNVEVYVAETYFSCDCLSAAPDCTDSNRNWPDHHESYNACTAEANQGFITRDGGCFDTGSYQCCLSNDNGEIPGVESINCCTAEGACVLSKVGFDTEGSNLLACDIVANNQACSCNVCSNNAITYDCTAAGRPDLAQACPTTSIDAKSVEAFYLDQVSLPFYAVDPNLRAGEPIQTPEQSLPTPPPVPVIPTLAPTLSPTKSLTPTSRPSSPPSPHPTSMPSSVPSSHPSGAPSSNPTAPTNTPSSTPSSAPTPEFVANCEGILYRLQRLNEGFGELTCSDYGGDFPGVVYACSADPVLINNEISLNIQPAEQSIQRKFQRECKAPAPNGLTFYCLDNFGNNFDVFLEASEKSVLDCGPDRKYTYAYSQFNLLQSVQAISSSTPAFDLDMANNAFLVQFLSNSTSVGQIASSWAVRGKVTTLGWILLTTLSALGVLSII
jgi:hypothetical protein